MDVNVYLTSLIGHIYKLVPLREELGGWSNTDFIAYIESLLIEVYGSLATFPELGQCAGYIGVVNTLQYMKTHEMSEKVCRREVFKAIRGLDYTIRKVGGQNV